MEELQNKILDLLRSENRELSREEISSLLDVSYIEVHEALKNRDRRKIELVVYQIDENNGESNRYKSI